MTRPPGKIIASCFYLLSIFGPALFDGVIWIFWIFFLTTLVAMATNFGTKIDYNSTPVKKIACCFHLHPYFRARAIRWRHLNFSPADFRSNYSISKEWAVRISYDVTLLLLQSAARTINWQRLIRTSLSLCLSGVANSWSFADDRSPNLPVIYLCHHRICQRLRTVSRLDLLFCYAE